MEIQQAMKSNEQLKTSYLLAGTSIVFIVFILGVTFAKNKYDCSIKEKIEWQRKG